MRKVSMLWMLWIAASIHLNAFPVDPLEHGAYPVATSNLQAHRPADATMAHYLRGTFINGEARYVSSLLDFPLSAAMTTVQVPNDFELYGVYADQSLPVLMVVLYPTHPDNAHEDYRFPYDGQPDTLFPRMQPPGHPPIPFHPQKRFPLIMMSHGHQSHALQNLEEMRFLASHGYVVAGIFHGDGRISDGQAERFLRPLMIKAATHYLLVHPFFTGMIDSERMGISGTSFGGFTGLTVLGAKFLNHPSSQSDIRYKAGFATVPWLGAGPDIPFPDDYASLANITAPFLAVVGERDTVAPPDRALEGLQHTSGPTYAFEFKGEGHNFSLTALRESRTLQVMFFDAFLKDSAISKQVLEGPVTIRGGVEDQKVLQRQPLAEPVDPSAPGE